MTLDDEQKAGVIGVRLENAHQALTDAEVLLKSGSCRGAINRAYYAMFHAVSALAISTGQVFRKHAALISFFQREFAKPELLDRKHGRALQKAFEDRSEADYEDYIDLDAAQVKNRLREAGSFIEAIEDFLVPDQNPAT